MTDAGFWNHNDCDDYDDNTLFVVVQTLLKKALQKRGNA